MQNQNIQEELQSENCDYCHEPSINFLRFSCNHKICIICLYRRIFCNNLKDLQNNDEIVTIKCKCDSGQLKRSFDEIESILQKKSELDKYKESERLKNKNDIHNIPICPMHPSSYKNFYCVDCFQNVCLQCVKNINDFHPNHRIISCDRLTKLIKRNISELPLKIPNKELFEKKFEVMGKKVKETAEKEFNETIKQIDECANSLYSFKKEYEEMFKRELTRCVKSLKLIKLFYLNYYYDKEICSESTDINLLRYVNNISFEFMDTNLNHEKIINLKFAEMKSNIDNMSKSSGQKTLTINFSYDNVPRSFKCEDIILKAHEKMIRSIIESPDQRIITAGYDYTMKIWEEGDNGFLNKNIIKQLCGAVTCLLQLKDERILSASATDNNIKVWVDDKKGGYDLRQSLTAHNKPVSTMVQLNDSRIITGSIDSTVMVWKEISNEFVVFQKITDEKRPIMKILNLFNNQFVLTTDDGIIKVYGFDKKNEILNNVNDSTINENFQLKNSLKKHIGRVNCMCELKNHYLVSGGAEIGNSADHYIIVWKPSNESYSYSQTLRGHQSDINAIIQLQDGRLASSSKDRTIRIWKMESNINGNNKFIEDEVLSDYGHGMYCLIQLSDGRLCSTSSDNSIIIWRNRTEDY